MLLIKMHAMMKYSKYLWYTTLAIAKRTGFVGENTPSDLCVSPSTYFPWTYPGRSSCLPRTRAFGSMKKEL